MRFDRDLRTFTVDEYLRLERDAEVRHELVGGERFALSGGTLRHNAIALNLAAHLRILTRDRGCRVFVSDVKVRVASDVFYYPDVVLTCAAVRDADVVVHDPYLLIEVTSPSTAAVDRREKLVAYRRLPSLQHYLIVSQHRRQVTLHSRDEVSGEWTAESRAGVGSLRLSGLSGSISLDDVYEGVALPVPGEPEPDEFAGFEA
ncbi:MAG: Uma2 family endonuclease [Gemmatimonadaceae bacterium]|nr:Uma2 family endonuclease [Gemmatimonadaceae bacterium]